MTISPVSHNTRPESQLLPQEAAAFDLLDKLGIEYDRVSHDAAFNMELCAEVSRVLDVSVCKNLFLCNRQKTAFYLLCMPPDKPFHTKDLSAQIGSSRLSFAPEESLWAAPRAPPPFWAWPTIRSTVSGCSSTARSMTRPFSPATRASAPVH